jgi:polysaccharide biosynthesis protein VpsI
MRRVLLVGPLLETGGISRFVKDLLTAGIGYDVHLFNTARPPKPHTDKGALGYRTLLALGVPWAMRNVLITGWNTVRFPFALLLSRAVLVHIATSSHWSFWESSVYLFCSKLLGRRVIFHYLSNFHKFYDSATVPERAMIRRVFKTADRVIVLSHSVREVVLSFVSERNVTVIPSTVGPDMFKARDTDRNKAAGEILVLFMGGNYGNRKGVNDLIAAIPRVLAGCCNVKFLLCGGGDVDAAYQSIVGAPRGAVKYLGWVDDAIKSQLLLTASIYVLPSYSEGMPYGIVEAMASGLAVIATNVGSIPEIVTDGENGVLISPGDIDALSGSILTLAKDCNLTRKMAKANRAKAARLFSSSKAFDAIRKNYDSLLGVSLRNNHPILPYR